MHIDAIRGWSGGQVQGLGLALGLARRGHDNLVICNRKAALHARATDAGLKCAAVRVRHPLDLRALSALLHIVRDFRPHVMHLHSSPAHVVGAVAARLVGVPAVVAHKRTDYLPDPMLRSWRWNRLIDAAIAVSGPAKLSLVRAGVPPHKVHVIYSAVDCARFSPAAGRPRDIGLPGGVPLVGAVGALDPHKGYDVLLRAAATIRREAPGAHFVFCGKGSAEQDLRLMAESLGPQAVTFMGQVEDVRPVLAAVSVLAHPAFREALGVAVIEAMAMGKPVVASATGGLREAIEHQVTGFLVPVGDADALADSILRVIQDPALAARLGRAARERALAVFSVEAMVEATERLYYALINAARA